MKTKEDILKELVPVIASALGRIDREIVPEANLVNDLGADSLDVVQMVQDIENKYNLRFTDHDLEQINTVQDAVDLVFKNLPK